MRLLALLFLTSCHPSIVRVDLGAFAKAPPAAKAPMKNLPSTTRPDNDARAAAWLERENARIKITLWEYS